MKIQYISDLHLEFPQNREYIKNNPIIPSADILIIAGDLGYLNLRRKHHIYEKYCDKLLEYCSKNWKYTIIVPGNHEYYGGALVPRVPARYYIYDNVVFLNDSEHTIESDCLYDLTIFGGTLWSNVPPVDQYIVSNCMNDYRLIKNKSKEPITINDTILLHKRFVEFASCFPTKNERLKSEKPEKLLIVSHHGCHPNCIADIYKGHKLNSAYYTNLCSLIDKIQPEAWIFGHTHSTQKFIYNDTIIAENCLGYTFDKYSEDIKFDSTLTIEI